ncbi:5'-deoxynucleotidase HD superfamily hydrolase [Methanonatronarchaeum thermophilum]|uniref:5'-deoxynucleotidase n=1 Tax=Methanonatronarchaeum thermophilum TaxID=1927129 RepID=A0A1Y3GHE2_9EURY|nr:HD family hydrolase [Methanonatronarchaeum thermophilum]OUJ18855.1 5'-deoxynucleotidase HD superfamily hydrolase [Methanonatronarchaeum thermophilum]
MCKEIDVESLKTLFQLKEEKRSGWVLKGIGDPESVADHSWGTAILALLFHGNLELDKCLKMALIHDILEVETGDIPKSKLESKQDVEAKKKKEAKALKKLQKELDSELLDSYIEYKKQSSREALFVKDMDLIDMCLQACIYQENKKDVFADKENDFDSLDGFFETTEPDLSTDIGVKLFKEIKSNYKSIE